jgi:Helix-turn-helix domain
MEITKDLYTVAEFCEAVRISIRHYYRLRAAGDGPRLTILGGRHLISRDETRRWLASHTERNYIDVY